MRLDRVRPEDEVEERVLRISQAKPGAAEDERRELPRDFTRGVRVVVTDVCFPLTYLPDGGPDLHPWRDNVLLPCRACPEPGIGFEVLPYSPEDRRCRQEQFTRLLAERGVFTTAALVQANPLLYERGEETLPALVLVTFEKDLADREALLRRLARRAYDLKEYRPRNDDEREVADIVLANDQGATYHRREQLPRSFTGGLVVFAADLWLFRPYLRHGRLEGEKIIPVLAEPGLRGGIEMLPCLEAEPAAEAEVVEVEQADPQVVDRAEEQRPRPSRRPPRRLVWPLMFGGLALIVLGVMGAGAIFWLAGDKLVVLSNVQARPAFAGQATYLVDYRFTAAPNAGARYFLVVESSPLGVKTEVGFGPAPAQGTLNVKVFQPVGIPGRVSFHVEEDRADGARRSVSNTISP
jgi:hypothetical protein